MKNIPTTPMQMRRRAVQLWTVPHASKTANRHNQRAWLRAVERLGDRWLLRRRVERKNDQQD